MDWTLDEIRRAARGGAIALPPEVAGYLMLGASESMRRVAVRFELDHVRLQLDGTVSPRGQETTPEVACGCVREGLAALLAAASSPHAALGWASRGDETEIHTVARRLEDALVPLNKAAARRQLARLCREMNRRFPEGFPEHLDDVDVADDHSPFPLVDSVASTPTIADAEVAERVAVEEASRYETIVPFAAIAESSDESTVRIDSLMAKLRAQPLLPTKARNSASTARPAPSRVARATQPAVREARSKLPRRPGSPGSRDSDVRDLAASFRVADERSARQMSRALKSSVGVEASQTPPPVLVEPAHAMPPVAESASLERLAKPAVAAALAVALVALSVIGARENTASDVGVGGCARSIVVRGAPVDAQVRLLSPSRDVGARIARGPVAEFPGAGCDERLEVLVAVGSNGAWKKLPVPNYSEDQPVTEITLDGAEH